MQVNEQVFPNAIIGNQPTLLENIHQKEKSIAIYQRDIAPLKHEIASALQKEITIKTSGTIDELSLKLKEVFAEQMPNCNELLADINEIISQFNKVAKATSYRLLLSTVSNNMCRKFHTDINDLRLLCTYAGPGTLWVAEDNSGAKEQKKEVLINEEDIQQVNTGDVIILKGALHPNGDPVLHRSPTIEEVNGNKICKRLLLRLDTNEFLGFD